MQIKVTTTVTTIAEIDGKVIYSETKEISGIKEKIEPSVKKKDPEKQPAKQITKKKKQCPHCKEYYQPTGNRQRLCPKCKEAGIKIEPIDYILGEIENNRKKPVDLSKK